MAEKTGAGRKPQEFDTENGRYLGNSKGYNSQSDIQNLQKAIEKSKGPNNRAVDWENGLTPRAKIDIPDTVIKCCQSFNEDEIRKSSGWLSGLGTEDEILKAIIQTQDFDKKPQVVNSEKLKELVNDGCLGFARGMKVGYGAEQYKTGEMYVGRGVHGSGVYVACYSELKDEEQAISTANRYATDRNTGNQGSVIIGVISKDAKIISKSQLIKIREELCSKWDDKLKMCFANNGKLAAALGYDVIDCENDSYYIVLNRGKTIVGE